MSQTLADPKGELPQQYPGPAPTGRPMSHIDRSRHDHRRNLGPGGFHGNRGLQPLARMDRAPGRTWSRTADQSNRLSRDCTHGFLRERPRRLVSQAGRSSRFSGRDGKTGSGINGFGFTMAIIEKTHLARPQTAFCLACHRLSRDRDGRRRDLAADSDRTRRSWAILCLGSSAFIRVLVLGRSRSSTTWFKTIHFSSRSTRSLPPTEAFSIFDAEPERPPADDGRHRAIFTMASRCFTTGELEASGLRKRQV